MTALKKLKHHCLASGGSRRRKVYGTGGSKDNFLTSGMCWIVVPLPKVNKNSLDQTCALLYKRSTRPKGFI